MSKQLPPIFIVGPAAQKFPQLPAKPYRTSLYVMKSEQEIAILEFLKPENPQKVFILKGSAGTAKTTDIQYLFYTIPNVFVVAPSNKAANVLRSKKDFPLPATTIHKAFYRAIPTGEYKIVSVPVIDPNTHKAKKDENGEIIVIDKKEPIFLYMFDVTAPGALSHVDPSEKICIVDESSMVRAEELYNLFKFPGKLILIGDDKQLPPVEKELEEMKKNGTLDPDIAKYEGFFANVEADWTKDKNYRQENKSTIHNVVNSILENDGEYPIPLNSNNAICADVTRNCLDPLNSKLFKDLVLFDSDSKIVISWTNTGAAYLNSLIRKHKFAEQYKNEPTERNGLPRVGDILYVASRYDGNVCITKGETLTIVELLEENISLQQGFLIASVERENIDEKTSKREIVPNVMIRLDFCGYPLSKSIRKTGTMDAHYGYSLTCHKVQGSEYEVVVVIDDLYGNKVDKCKWIYTAATRAKDCLFIVKFPYFNRIASGGK